MNQEFIVCSFESETFIHVGDLSEAEQSVAGFSFYINMPYSSLPNNDHGLEIISEAIQDKGPRDTDSDCKTLPSQPPSPLLDFDYKDEARRKSSMSSVFGDGDPEEQVDLFERLPEPDRPLLIDLVVAAVQSKSISEAMWSSLGPRGQALTIAWLTIEICKDNQKLLQLGDSSASLLNFANELLRQRTPKRTDLYKRTFYKSFIQHLLGKYTQYKHTKAYKIKPYTEAVAAKFFSSSDEQEQQELRSIFENTKHFSVPNLKRLFRASVEFKGEFDRYIRVELQQETEKGVREFAQRLDFHLSNDQLEVIQAALSIVDKRTLVPWTSFDVSAAQDIYSSMTEKC